jgi:hypothetical protein
MCCAGVQVGILFAERLDAQGGIEVVVKDVYADAPAAASGWWLFVSPLFVSPIV